MFYRIRSVNYKNKDFNIQQDGVKTAVFPSICTSQLTTNTYQADNLMKMSCVATKSDQDLTHSDNHGQYWRQWVPVYLHLPSCSNFIF